MRIERFGSFSALGLLMLVAGTATALAADGLAHNWQLGMPEPASNVARGVDVFHTYLVWLVTLLSLFVLALLVVCVVRYNENANPVPSRTTHNTMLEVAWTIVPVLILVAIAVPSFRLLREQLVIPQHDIVVKATGYSWYWGYEYPADQGGFRFESNMVPEGELKPGQPRLLAVDNEMVVPVGKVVKLQVTAGDVLHAFGVPHFGIMIDAVPGRLNETWFRPERTGVYYGQCRELCGNGHPYMPIAVRVVTEQEYAAWLEQAKARFARIDGAGEVRVAESR